MVTALLSVLPNPSATDATGPPDEIYARAWVRGYDFAVLTDHDVLVGRRLFPSLQDEIAWITDAFDKKKDFSTRWLISNTVRLYF